MLGTCKLCKNEKELKNSHIIPKFIGKWVKKTSITGRLREKNEIHKPKQDTTKEYWLCGDCEQLFSNWEREFANKIFYPFVDNDLSNAKYSNWLSLFCTSLSWRALTYIRSKNQNDPSSKEYNIAINDAEKHLSKYLLGQVSNLFEYEQHIIPLETITTASVGNMSANINRYLLRTMAMDIVGNETTEIFIYTKLPSFIILGIVRTKYSSKMRPSRVSLKSGRISPKDYWLPGDFNGYMNEKAEEISILHNSIPINQRDGFDEYIQNNPKKAINSKLTEAFLKDYNLFGDSVFK